MISYLEGSVVRVAPTSLVLSVQGVGFSVAVAPAVSAAARVGSSMALHTKLVVKKTTCRSTASQMRATSAPSAC